MPRYAYVALDSRGQESTGSVEAISSNEAIGQLRQAGYFPTSVYQEGKDGPDGKILVDSSFAIVAPKLRLPEPDVLWSSPEQARDELYDEQH